MAKKTHTPKASANGKPAKKSRKAKGVKREGPAVQEADQGTDKKLSALDAAAQVLAESSQPMNCQEMIAIMAQKGLWTSPGGKTPAATLYSAILKEIRTKEDQSRFQKTARGKFARK